jgi:hypothetical protein
VSRNAAVPLPESIAHYVVRPWLVPQIDAPVPIPIFSANQCLSKVSTTQAELIRNCSRQAN